MSGWSHAETERRLANMIRIATIEAVDDAKRKIKVVAGDMHSGWLPWPVEMGRNFRRWRPLRPGQQLVLAAPSGDLTQAVVVGMLYTNSLAAPSTDPDIDLIEFEDGTTVEHNVASHQLTVTQTESSANVTVNCPGHVTVNSPRIDLGEQSALEPSVLGDQLAAWITKTLKLYLDQQRHIGNLGFPTGPAQEAPHGPFNEGPGKKGGAVYSQRNRNQ